MTLVHHGLGPEGNAVEHAPKVENQIADSMIEYEIEPQAWWRISFREYWRYRELFYFLAWRDILVKYKQMVLGVLWAFLQPLVLMVVLTVFWSHVIRQDTNNLPYPIFAYSGLILWGLFASAVSNAAGSMIENVNLIKKVYFPRAIIPLSALVVAIFDFGITLIIFMLLTCYYHMASSFLRLICLLPVCIGIVIFSAMGLGLALAAANVKYRDFRYVVPFLLQVLFFATPVIFPVSIFEAQPVIAGILLANPVSCAIDLLRGALVNEPILWGRVLIAIFTAGILFPAGFAVFKKVETDCADPL